MEQQNTNHMQKRKFNWSQTLGIVVIVLLVAAGIGTAIELGPRLPGVFSNIAAAAVTLSQKFISGGEQLILEASPSTATSGETIELSWTHKNQKSEGVYSLSYPCREGVDLILETPSGDDAIECGTSFDVYSENQLITVVAFSDLDSMVQIPVTLTYTSAKDAGFSLSALATVSITDSAPTETVGTTEQNPEVKPEATPKNTPVTIPVEKTPKPKTPGERTEKTYVIGEEPKPLPAYGKADLTPKILEVGVIDKITNVFTATATTSLRASDRIAVRFEVENLGTASSGHWQFSAVLPTFPMHIFESEGQQSLAPGDRIEYTIGFDNVEPDVDGRFVINVDPTSSLPEASESNNIATTTIRASL